MGGCDDLMIRRIAKTIAMLKITTVKTNRRFRLVLEGKLAAPWLSGLIKEWRDARASAQGVTIFVDLRNVTFISEEGESILLGMMSDGARFICRGVLNRHVLQQLARKRRKLSRRRASS